MIEQAIQIKSLFEAMNGGNSLFSMNHNQLTGNLEFQVFDPVAFVKIAEENNKKYEVKCQSYEDYPYTFETVYKGIKFIILADQDRYEYIMDKLF